jgi:hypothetical protein
MSDAESKEERILPHEGHADPSIAYHIRWPYSDRAFLWNDRITRRRKAHPCGVNFQPLATQLRLWLLRQGGEVSYFKHDPKGRGWMTLTNPYTESGSVLTLMYADAVNEAHAFTTSTVHMDDVEAEMRRARFYSEIALLNVRVSEACIKQLLHCTAISTKDYKKATLRGLLDSECRACDQAGKPHKISLLGSLAHRFHLCVQIESCLATHLAIANRRRNTQASHATFSGFEPKPVAQVRARLDREVTELGDELVHLLQHIGQIEEKMREELEHALFVGMKDPSWQSM